MMKTRVIQLYAGPGAGKSTMAAQIFAELKTRGYSVELIHEYVKSWAWSGHKIEPHHTSVLYGAQFQLESDLYGKVQYLVTDSPVDLRVVFEQHYGTLDRAKLFEGLWDSDRKLVTEAGLAEFLPVFIRRGARDYDSRGRYESEGQARELDRKIWNYLTVKYRVFGFLAEYNDANIEYFCDSLTDDEVWAAYAKA